MLPIYQPPLLPELNENKHVTMDDAAEDNREIKRLKRVLSPGIKDSQAEILETEALENKDMELESVNFDLPLDNDSKVWDGKVETCDKSECDSEVETCDESECDSNHPEPTEGILGEKNKGKTRINLEDITRETRDRKATKADDAKVPEYLWLEHLVQDGERKWTDDEIMRLPAAMHTVRERCLRWWKKRVTMSLVIYVQKRYEKYNDGKSQERRLGLTTGVEWQESHKIWSEKEGWKTRSGWVWKKEGKEDYKRWWRDRMLKCGDNIVPGRDAIERTAQSSWWGWDDGSQPLHWRWPEFFRERIQDGLKVHFQKPPPRYQRAQRDVLDPKIKEKVIEKLEKVRARRYIAPGYVVSLTAFFQVPKGDDDIRMVYDGTVSGLNDSIWVPRFALPTVNTHLRAVEEGTFMADFDVGDCFLNFPLHKDLRALCGVDLTLYFPILEGDGLWEAWTRAAMGLKSSPYQAVQAMGVVQGVIMGDRLCIKNIFRWDFVRMNLPGSDAYDPSLPWVSKVRADDGRIASDLFTFVDDGRPTGSSRKNAWLATRRSASMLNHLGIQDAARKRRDSSQCPGAWAGCIIRATPDGVFVLTSLEKWKKLKAMLQEIWEMLKKDPAAMPRKRLEQIRGFVMHVAQTYPFIATYMIGIHMTIDGWRQGRDADGWQIKQGSTWEAVQDEDGWMFVSHDDADHQAPVEVEAVPRLGSDIEALQALTSSLEPPV